MASCKNFSTRESACKETAKILLDDALEWKENTQDSVYSTGEERWYDNYVEPKARSFVSRTRRVIT